MSRQLFWKMCIIFATGVVALFYFINLLTSRTEEGMSMLALEHRQQITDWGRRAEKMYKSGDIAKLSQFLEALKQQENTWVSVVSFDYANIAGDPIKEVYQGDPMFGRSVDWKIHLYLDYNPVMEVAFENVRANFLIQLPKRMRPGAYWRYIQLTIQIIIPTILLALLCVLFYRYIMKPLLQLQSATRLFSEGRLDIRASEFMGKRNDEFSDLAKTFDDMASRIGEQILNQRQLIADLSHELRTPLTRLDIALATVNDEQASGNIKRIARESKHIRRLVEDTLSLAWIENENPKLKNESLDLIDLLDVLIADAIFEFPDKNIISQLPDTALIENSNHRALGQAIENILRNALRYTPKDKVVEINLLVQNDKYEIAILDRGPGVPKDLLKTIFKPFFRVDKSRERNGNSFGLGLALAQRQLSAIRGEVIASNRKSGGLAMVITIPKK
ncbi:histidine kinase sensor domain-containing protein [Thalassotalea sp. PP2-459]|uniref:histidine kinase sensor domain-containing protein n=1 Tax=Thalassotalea sp. PP2-459 TaxID=1742724 RepID=UPI0009423B97|nr:histidine kinase sensor domain-containing protein [Thalassotalea sp. PP2-459]OKY27805.1 two-component sensor histidine kinase [Thalassotalea sp. PP2-459]